MAREDRAVKSLARPILGLLCLLATGRHARAESATSTIESRSMVSATLGHEISYQVYLPAGYVADGSHRYPVIYLLHGRGDKQTAWATVKPDLDGLIAEGCIPALIAVMPDAPSSRRAGR